MKRILVFLILAAVLAAEIYYQQPVWWVYFLKPVLTTAWKATLALPVKIQLMLALTAGLVAFAIWFVKKWGTHVLLATAVLSMVPGISLWLTLQMVIGTAFLAIVMQVWHHLSHRGVQIPGRVEPKLQ